MGTEVFNRIAVSQYTAYQVIPQGLLFTLEEISIQNLVKRRRCHAILVWRGEKLTFQENHTGTALTEGSMVRLTTEQIWDTRRFGGGEIFLSPVHYKKEEYYSTNTSTKTLYLAWKSVNQALIISVWLQACRGPGWNDWSRYPTIPAIFSVKSFQKMPNSSV